ncbi:PREDICTED: 15-hydroxyprostaglandin dehydrogenase [NAD(+)]-like [Eufriesea mexicana]|nr:PREDICTED: 15-hydroxyprostaglandin dehydrogenase [NAD(+)]-like [Eufriesea mexicana]
MTVKNSIAVITGGASGIGLSCAEQFLLEDAKFIAILDLPSTNAEDVVAKLKNQFGQDRVGFFPCDVTKDDQVNSSFDKIVESLGSFDILINSAGILSRKDKWDVMVNVNVTGLTRTTIKAIDLIGKHNGGKGGTIVNIASIAGFVPVPVLPCYAATKHAVVGFTKSLSYHYEKTGVRMMMVCPGSTITPMSINLDQDMGLSFVSEDEVIDFKNQQIKQPPEYVSKAMVQLIEKGENGAVCMVYDCEPPYLLKVPTFYDLVKSPL